MNGTRPEFLKDVKLDASYYEPADPYRDAPSCHIDLVALSRYSRKIKKPVAEMTADEIKQFAI